MKDIVQIALGSFVLVMLLVMSCRIYVQGMRSLSQVAPVAQPPPVVVMPPPRFVVVHLYPPPRLVQYGVAQAA